MLEFLLFCFVLFGSIASSMARADDGILVRGFMDAGFVYDKSDASNQWRDGTLDLFLTKSIDQKINFLTELVYEPIEDNSIGSDLERFSAQYVVSPWCKIAIGRFHTALGYWNETFHHGAYLQTTVSRPISVRFEDQGGLLPTHLVGMEVRGNGQVGRGNLGYVADTGNGRGPQKDPPQIFHDADQHKAVAAVLFYEMDSGLRFGINGYLDTLPGGAITLADGSTTQAAIGRESIWGAHLVYNSPQLEILNEGWILHHNYTSINPATNQADPNSRILLFYTQLGVHLGLFTPYYRFENIILDGDDRYLAQSKTNPLTGNQRYHTLGLRYEVTQSSALKIEHEMIHKDGQSYSFKDSLNWSIAL